MVVGVTSLPKIPVSYSLSQNYPNPFNPTTIIKYQLPKQEKVTLEIFNALGQKVKTLVNEFKNAGYYQETWNGTNDNNISVATGVYIYRLLAGNFVISKKMILLK
jgi:flagellar hook assembly protein FlgD